MEQLPKHPKGQPPRERLVQGREGKVPNPGNYKRMENVTEAKPEENTIPKTHTTVPPEFTEVPSIAFTPPKEEPVRQASGVTIFAAALVILANKTGWADLSVEESTVIMVAVFALANEVARYRVWAKYK